MNMDIFNIIPCGICGFDKTRKITLWNKEIEQITGIKNKDIINKEPGLINFYETKESLKKINIFECIDEESGKAVTVKIRKSLYIETNKNKRKFVFVQIAINRVPEYPKIIVFITDLSKEYFCKYIESKQRNVDNFYGIVGRHKKMQELFELIRLASESLANVLIAGESGTGKELVAKAIHDNSDRKEKPFIIVNCSALTETLLESELFGHVKGSFTGAYKDKTGKFEIANGGTIFLDEIGDISPVIQLKLLRVIQERTFERVGDNKQIKVDIRIIAATNKNLRKLIQKELFREDLFYRLKVFPIDIIPLRERKNDIPLLCDHFIKGFNESTGKNIRGVTSDAKRLLMDYCWPGNIREFKNCIELSFALCTGRKIDSFDLPEEIKTISLRNEVCLDNGNKLVNSRRLNISKNELKSILITNNWNKSETARQLGISRVALWKKIKNMGINN